MSVMACKLLQQRNVSTFLLFFFGSLLTSLLRLGTRGIRDSWQTTGSASTYLEGLNFNVPTSPAHIYHSSRLSIGSIATFMTDASADAVVPRTPMPTRRAMRRSRPVSVYTVTEDGPWSDGDEDVLDSYIFGEI